MEPVFRSATVSDVLHPVTNVDMETARVIVDVSDYDLGVGVVITSNVFNVKFTLEHSSYIDGVTAAVNSRRGIDIGLSGATLDFAMRKLT